MYDFDQLTELLGHIHWIYILWTFLFACLLFFLGPLVILFTFKVKSKAVLEELSSNAPKLPGSVEEHFEQSEADLRSLGFELLNTFVLPAYVSGVHSVVQYWGHRVHQTSALVGVTYAESAISVPDTPPISIVEYHVEFSTMFENGAMQDSTNSTSFGSLPRQPDKSVNNLYWTKDVSQLYRLQRTAVKQQKLMSPTIYPLESEYDWDCQRELSEAMEKDFDYAAERGYLYLSKKSGLYRPTLKGAVIITWSQLPPFKQIAKLIARFQIYRLMQTSDYEIASTD